MQVTCVTELFLSSPRFLPLHPPSGDPGRHGPAAAARGAGRVGDPGTDEERAPRIIHECVREARGQGQTGADPYQGIA